MKVYNINIHELLCLKLPLADGVFRNEITVVSWSLISLVYSEWRPIYSSIRKFVWEFHAFK